MPAVPTELRTTRLLLRPWRAEDAANLLPILESNATHLGPWIPARVAEPAPVPVLEQRLAGFGAEFAADREWRFGMFTLDGRTILGEVGLFPRVETGRVPFADSDRVELGYWLRFDETGRGIVTEAASAVLAVAAAIPQFSRVEIRCDERNERSGAVPRRLGFALAETIVDSGVVPAETAVHLQVWTSELSNIRAAAG